VAGNSFQSALSPPSVGFQSPSSRPLVGPQSPHLDIAKMNRPPSNRPERSAKATGRRVRDSPGSVGPLILLCRRKPCGQPS
jgi:hypothetical protein